MKKAILIALVAILAVSAAFANTSDKDGFAIKVDAIGIYGTYGATYRMGDFEFGVGYLTYMPAYVLYEFFGYAIDEGEWNFNFLPIMFYPVGGLASFGYKFLATDQHEVGAILSVGYVPYFNNYVTVELGVEYDFCFDAHNAVYIKAQTLLLPFAPLEGFAYASEIGYRYTF